MSPGRECLELDIELTASQSQDCEPTPPLQRQGSKNNFYLPSYDTTDSARMSYVTRTAPHPSRPRYIILKSNQLDFKFFMFININYYMEKNE